jgi:hypothetical protein
MMTSTSAHGHFESLNEQLRRPAWEIVEQQLKTKTHRVYGVHSESPKTHQNRYRRSSLVLTRQKCGRTGHRHFSGLTVIRQQMWKDVRNFLLQLGREHSPNCDGGSSELL